MKKPSTRLLEGAWLSCGALVVRIGFGLFLTPYMLSVLGDQSYGVFALASLFAGWCGLLDFGLTTTTSRFVTRCYTRQDWRGMNEIGSTAIVLFGGISGLVFLTSCAAYGAAFFIGPQIDEPGTLGTALFFAGLAFAISKISDGFCGVLRGALRQEITGVVSLATRIAYGVVNVATLWFGGGVVALLVANTLLTLAQLIAWLAIVRRVVPEFRFSLRYFRRQRIRALFNYGFFTFLAQAGEILVTRSDLILIALLLSMEDVTRYNLAVVVLTSYYNSFLTEGSSWETNWFAHLGALERTTEDAKSEEKKTPFSSIFRAMLGDTDRVERLSAPFHESRALITRASTYGGLFGAFGILILGRFFIERWIGAEYLCAYWPLAIVVASQGLYRGASEVNMRLLQGLARHEPLALGALLHGVFNVLLSVVLVKAGWGLKGVAIGTALPGLAIYYFWLPNVVCAVIGEELHTYWKRQLSSTLIAIGGLILPGYWCLRFCQPTYWSIALFGGISFFFYAFWIMALGMKRGERDLVRRAIQKRLHWSD